MIANSTEQLAVQAMQKQKSVLPPKSNESKNKNATKLAQR